MSAGQTDGNASGATVFFFRILMPRVGVRWMKSVWQRRRCTGRAVCRKDGESVRKNKRSDTGDAEMETVGNPGSPHQNKMKGDGCVGVTEGWIGSV